jgi:hypothetical protein
LEGSYSFFLKEYGESSAKQTISKADSALAELREAVGEGDKIIKSASCRECAFMRRLLMRMVRLKEGSLDAYTVPLAGTDELLKDAEAQTLLGELEHVGLVRKKPETVNADAVYVFTHEKILREWKFLNKLATQRKAFREMARGWNTGGKQRAALLSGGPQLDAALSYRDLDAIEQDFIEASQRRVSTYLLSFLITLVVLAVLAGVLSRKIAAFNAEKQKANSNLELAIRNAHFANARLDQLQNSWPWGPLLVQKATSGPPDTLGDWGNYFYNFDTTPSWRINLEDNTLLGVLADILVSESYPNAIARAQKYADALTKARITIPLGGPRARKNVPDDTSEVRYYYDSDKDLADKVMQLLIQAGIPSKKIRISLVNDKTAPRKFIQVSLANTAFS